MGWAASYDSPNLGVSWMATGNKASPWRARRSVSTLRASVVVYWPRIGTEVGAHRRRTDLGWPVAVHQPKAAPCGVARRRSALREARSQEPPRLRSYT